TETTALGAAFLAGLATGYWSGLDELRSLTESAQRFEPHMEAEKMQAAITGWRDALRRTLSNYGR
ncbi:MAG TPA: glycerol kinase, partial [Bacteroides sp.]|nr:glycerol kinase [Bacteroides sp.]